jgi:hypothetical protein
MIYGTMVFLTQSFKDRNLQPRIMNPIHSTANPIGELVRLERYGGFHLQRATHLSSLAVQMRGKTAT